MSTENRSTFEDWWTSTGRYFPPYISEDVARAAWRAATKHARVFAPDEHRTYPPCSCTYGNRWVCVKHCGGHPIADHEPPRALTQAEAALHDIARRMAGEPQSPAECGKPVGRPGSEGTYAMCGRRPGHDGKCSVYSDVERPHPQCCCDGAEVPHDLGHDCSEMTPEERARTGSADTREPISDHDALVPAPSGDALRAAAAIFERAANGHKLGEAWQGGSLHGASKYNVHAWAARRLREWAHIRDGGEPGTMHGRPDTSTPPSEPACDRCGGSGRIKGGVLCRCVEATDEELVDQGVWPAPKGEGGTRLPDDWGWMTTPPSWWPKVHLGTYIIGASNKGGPSGEDPVYVVACGYRGETKVVALNKDSDRPSRKSGIEHIVTAPAVVAKAVIARARGATLEPSAAPLWTEDDRAALASASIIVSNDAPGLFDNQGLSQALMDIRRRMAGESSE